jgi:aspartate dehydrogenase
VRLARDQGRLVRIVLLGLGAINRRVVHLLQSRNSRAKIVGVIVKHPEAISAEIIAEATVIGSPNTLIELCPDIVLEAASREAVQEWGDVALRAARRFVVSSASAFAEDKLLQRLREVALRFGSQLVLSPGALGGIDALSAAARLGLQEVRHRIVKSPASWGAAACEKAAAPAARADPIILFSGCAREAAKRYPLNANVTVVSALSGIGLDATLVELVSDSSLETNRHELHAIGDFGSLTITLENRPLRGNPRSSELAALALVRLVENEVSALSV